MKKQLFAFLLLPLLAFVAADWVAVDLDNRVNISFPTKPETKDMNGNTMWLNEVSANARCMAIIIDFTAFGLDSASLAEEMNKEEAMEQFKVGIAGQIPGAKIISEKVSTTQGKKTFDLVIDMGKKDSTSLNKMYSKSIIVGTKMYTVSFYEKDSAPQDEIKNKFFNSIKIK